MKRDMDLVRKILRQAADKHDNELTEISVDGYDNDLITLHCQILLDAGFLKGTQIQAANENVPVIWIERLTWAGQDFLDAVKNDSIWQKVKDRLAKIGGEASLEVTKAVAIQVAKETLGL